MTTPICRKRWGGGREARLFGLGLLLLSSIPLIAPGMTRPACGQEAADPASVLESLREKRKLQEEQQEREFRRLLEEGRTLLAQHAYDQAKRVLGQAAKLRPGDQACERLLAEAQAASPAPADPERLLERIRDDQQTKNALLHVQLAASLFEAEKDLKAGNHRRAAEHAERVLDSVAYVTDAERAAKLRAQAETLLAAARAAGERAKAEELQATLAAHRERAARDKAATIESLNRQGWAHLDKGEAEQALAVAEEMLKLEPGNRQALWLRQKAREAIDSRSDISALRAQRKELEKKHLVDQLEDEMTLPADARAKIVLPGKRRPGDFVARDDRSMEPWEQQYRAKLRQPVDVEFKGATIAEACRYLSEAADCTMILDTAVAKSDARITLPKMTMSLEHALRWVCRIGKATFTLRDHAILVTTKGGLLEEPVTKSYDITSLLIPSRSIRTTFTGGSQSDDQTWNGRDVLSQSRSTSTREEDSKPVSEDVLGEAWVAFLRNTVAPETWEEPGREAPGREAVLQQRQPYTISYRNGRIVVVHVPEVQEQIERLLNDFRKSRNLQVHIFARFLRVQMDFLQRYDLDFVGQGFNLADHDLGLTPTLDPATLLPLTPTQTDSLYGYVSQPLDPWQQGAVPPKRSTVAYLYNDSQLSATDPDALSPTSGPLQIRCSRMSGHACNALLQAVVKRRKGTVLQAPRLTCFNTQRANFQAVTNYNYVRSLNSDGEPEIGNVPDGIIFDVQPFVSSDRRYITLVLQPQMRTLINSGTLQTTGFTYAVAGLIPYRTVQLPDTELRSVATTVTIPDGGTILAGGLAKVTEASAQASVPILHDIPLLRYLFREWTQIDTRDSLLVLVTAEIVPDIFEE